MRTAQDLTAAIEVALDVIAQHPSEWTGKELELFLDSYRMLRYHAEYVDPDPRIQKARLAGLETEALTYFNEGSGPVVDAFWVRVAALGLPYARRDRLAEILRRGRIKSRVEYELAVDLLVVAQQEGRIDAAQAKSLAQWIGDYESARTKRRGGQA